MTVIDLHSKLYSPLVKYPWFPALVGEEVFVVSVKLSRRLKYIKVNRLTALRLEFLVILEILCTQLYVGMWLLIQSVCFFDWDEIVKLTEWKLNQGKKYHRVPGFRGGWLESSCARSIEECIKILMVNVKNTHFLILLSQNTAISTFRFNKTPPQSRSSLRKSCKWRIPLSVVNGKMSMFTEIKLEQNSKIFRNCLTIFRSTNKPQTISINTSVP